MRRCDARTASWRPQLATTGTLPGTLAHDIAGVAGLSSVVQPSTNIVRSHVTSHATTPTTCADDGGETSTTPNSLGGYTALQEAQLYGVTPEWAQATSVPVRPSRSTNSAPTTRRTWRRFLQCYGLTPSITPISVDGGPTGSYDDEPTLDIEQAAALAPGASFEVYQGPNNSTGPLDTYTQIADDDTATIISTSWGTCESDPEGDPSAEQPIFEQMSAQGQTVVSAAGDSGSSDCNGITNNDLAVDDPASQPFVTGVGGLTISDISPLIESVWDTPAKSGEAVPAVAGSRYSGPARPGRLPPASPRASRCASSPTSPPWPIPAPGSFSTSPGPAAVSATTTAPLAGTPLAARRSVRRS